jgi:riboflavin biosynthesis pyrimidine reductase
MTTPHPDAMQVVADAPLAVVRDDEMRRRESLRVVLDEHTRGDGNTVPMRLGEASPEYAAAQAHRRPGWTARNGRYPSGGAL